MDQSTASKSRDCFRRRVAAIGIVLGLSLAFVAVAPAQQQNPLKLAWRIKVPSDADSSPAVDGKGNVYFGTFNGQLWAYSGKGDQLWKFDTGMEIWSSPAIAENGTIYFGCRDRNLYALTPEGGKKWRFKTGGWVDASVAIGQNGTIYFGSRDKNFYAVDANGRELWRFKTGGPIVSSAAIGTNGLIYFGSHDGKLYALSAEGREVWSYKSGGAILSSPALDAAEGVFFTSVDGNLYALAADGKLRWRIKTGGVGVASPAVAADGTVFIGVNREMWGVTRDGKRSWVSGGDEIDSTAVLTADGTIMFLFRHGQIQGCDQARSLASQWDTGVDYAGVSSLTVEAGKLYALAGRNLHTFEWNSPLLAGAWPKFRGNARNTGNQADLKFGSATNVTASVASPRSGLSQSKL